MTKEFNALTFIGRFSPFHNGHASVVEEALSRAEQVIIVVGSSFTPRNARNPFTFEERKTMIKAVFPQPEVVVVPVADYPYDENKWIASVQSLVYSNLKFSTGPLNLGLIGYNKDHTSYYLNIFPTWDSISVPVYKGANGEVLNSTEIRYDYIHNFYDMDCSELPFAVQTIIEDYMSTSAHTDIINEAKIVQAYKDSWAVGRPVPYAPTFVTTDAVVIQSGHILLVKRKASPGKGQWALPGGFLEPELTLLENTLKELREETKLKVPTPVLLRNIKDQKTFDAPHRSTRGRTITTAFYIDLGFSPDMPKVKGSSDAKEAKWVPFSEVDRTMMFEDHAGIIDYFLNISGL